MGTTFTCVASGDWDDDATWGLADGDYPGKSGATDDVVIIDVANKSGGAGALTVTLVADVELKAIKMAGTGAGDATLHTASEHTLTLNDTEFSGYSAHVTGQTEFTGNVNFTFTKSGTTHIIIDPASQTNKLNDITCNHASLALHLLSAITIKGNLNCLLGSFSTQSSGGGTSHAVTVAGSITGNGTFTANASTVTVTGQTTVATVNITTGTYNYFDDFRPTTCNITDNATFNQTSTGGQFGGRIIITASKTPTFNAVGRLHSSLDIQSGEQGNSTFNLDLSEDQNGPARALFFHNLELDSEGTEANTYTMKGAITCTGDLVITDGEINTESGVNHALTVEAELKLNGGTLTCNASDVIVRNIWGASGTLSAPSNSSTNGLEVTGRQTGGDNSNYSMYFVGTTLTNNDGLIVLSADVNTFIRMPQVLANFKIRNDGSSTTRVHEFTMNFECDHDLTLENGTFQSYGTTQTLTVGDDVLITKGTLGRTSNAAAYSFGSLTIATNGIFIATSGETSITGAGGISRTGTFTHNNGTVDFEAATTVIQDTTMTGSNAFYILKSTGTTWYRIDQDIDIERHASTGYVFWFYGNVTVTMGTDTYSSGTDNSNKCIGWSYVYGHTSSTYKLYAKNELYPWLYDYANVGNSSWINGSQDARMGIAHLKGGNIIGDFSIAETTNPKSIVLDGDMEFDGVTVGNTNTLDLNGQRAVFGGDVNPLGTFNMTNSLVFMGSRFSGAGTGTVTKTGSTVVFENTSSKTNLGDSNGVEFHNCFINNTSGTMDFIEDWDCSGFLTVGAGTFKAEDSNSGSNNINAQDVTIATGGNLTMESTTLTVAGDFTTSGGLIGKSALDMNGTSTTCTVSDASDFDSLTNATWMGWYKIDDVSADRNFMGQSSSFSLQVIENSTNKPRFSLYDGGSWTDLEGNTTITVDNKWHHIAFVMDGSNNKMYIYLDGKLDAEGAWTGTLNGSGADIYLGGYRSGNEKHFAGLYDSASFWNVALTAPQIRAKMFSDFASLDSNTGCKGWWQFDEGTGTSVASSVGSHTATVANGAWAGAATFVDGTSTIDFTGNGEWAISDTTTNYYNVKVAASGKTTTIRSVGGSEKRPRITNLLTHGGGTLTDIGNADITFYSTGTHTAGADLSGLYITYWPSSTDIPGGTYQYLITQHNDLSCTGDINCGGYFAVSSGEGFDLKNNTLTTGRMILYANSTYNMDAGSLIFDSTSGMTGDYAGRTFTAGPGATISGVAAKSGFFSDNNYVVVGNIENLDVSNEELKVTGLVTNCIGPIHQYFPTIDHDQQIDADTADDRDIQLHGDKLDRNTELINS